MWAKRPERGLSMLDYCLQWDKCVLRIHIYLLRFNVETGKYSRKVTTFYVISYMFTFLRTLLVIVFGRTIVWLFYTSVSTVHFFSSN